MKKALLLVTTAAIGLMTLDAWAVDNRMLPASMCQKIDGTGFTQVGWEGKVSNLASGAQDILRLQCPIIRDAWNGPPSWIGAYAVDANNGGQDTTDATNVCCQFYSTDLTGSGTVFWGNAKQCSFGSHTPNPLPFTVINGPAGSFQNGTELLFCEVPPFANGTQPSALFGYGVVE